MKRFLMTATALVATLTGTVAASAQDGYRGGYDRGDRGGYDRDYRGDRGGYDRDQRGYRGDRRDDRRDWRGGRGDRGRYARYARGQRYRGDGAYLSDYGRYGYRAPPRGYRYYRTNGGDVVLAAVATGIIASVIASSSSRY
jgi:Ni/Co efflux regulator RcnB